MSNAGRSWSSGSIESSLRRIKSKMQVPLFGSKQAPEARVGLHHCTSSKHTGTAWLHLHFAVGWAIQLPLYSWEMSTEMHPLRL